MKKKGVINIIEANCLGCGFCEKFCRKSGIIVVTGEKFSTMGFPLPSVVRPDECNACGDCEVMCPHFAIEVYELIEGDVQELSRGGAQPGAPMKPQKTEQSANVSEEAS